MSIKMNYYLPADYDHVFNITQNEVDKIQDSIQGIEYLLKGKTIDILIRKINPLVFDVGDLRTKSIYSFDHSNWKWRAHREEDYEEEIKWNWQKQSNVY